MQWDNEWHSLQYILVLFKTKKRKSYNFHIFLKASIHWRYRVRVRKMLTINLVCRLHSEPLTNFPITSWPIWKSDVNWGSKNKSNNNNKYYNITITIQQQLQQWYWNGDKHNDVNVNVNVDIDVDVDVDVDIDIEITS